MINAPINNTSALEEDSLDGEPSDIVYPSAIPFVLVHLVCFAAIWTGVTVEAVVLGLLYTG